MSKKSTRQTIWDHVREIGTCMMVTHHESGVRARPMRALPRPEENAIWFFANKESEANNEPESDPRACLTFVDSKDNVFVSLSGRVSHVSDKTKIHELWSDEAASYFVDGPDDSRVTLIHFRPETGEFWTSPSSPIVIAIKFLEAKIMGERPNLGSNARTALS